MSGKRMPGSSVFTSAHLAICSKLPTLRQMSKSPFQALGPQRVQFQHLMRRGAGHRFDTVAVHRINKTLTQRHDRVLAVLQLYIGCCHAEMAGPHRSNSLHQTANALGSVACSGACKPRSVRKRASMSRSRRSILAAVWAANFRAASCAATILRCTGSGGGDRHGFKVRWLNALPPTGPANHAVDLAAE